MSLYRSDLSWYPMRFWKDLFVSLLWAVIFTEMIELVPAQLDAFGELIYYDEAEESRLSSIKCQDHQENCELWASQGECDKNPSYMLPKCPKSCQTCGLDDEIAKRQRLDHATDLGISQALVVADETHTVDILFVITKARNYIKSVASKKYSPEILQMCKNKHQECASWAFLGECDKNPVYMNEVCAPMCTTCETFARL